MFSTVNIRDNADGRVDISYCPVNSLQAKVLTVPKKAFLEACSEYADGIEAAAIASLEAEKVTS